MVTRVQPVHRIVDVHYDPHTDEWGTVEHHKKVRELKKEKLSCKLYDKRGRIKEWLSDEPYKLDKLA